MQDDKSAIKVKEIVMEFLKALENRDFKSARRYVSDNMYYVGPLGSFDTAESYLKYFEHLNISKFEIKKAFMEGNDVCLLYNLNFGTPPVTVFVCGCFQLEDNDDFGKRISSIRVVFDPRPLLEQQEENK